MKLNISSQATEFLATQKVVALESTVYSHLGLPLPERQTALEQSKKAIQDCGACPAVIALLEGEIFVGLTPEQEQQIIESQNPKKMSLRDIPIALAEKWDLGVTTVSATMALAHQAGIKVMATGGIGGVHRNDKKGGGKRGDDTGDVSADLTALGRYPVGVVSAGAKGFLDLPRTLELLETLGVPVIGYQTDTFPAFWCESSGLAVPHRVESPKASANIISNLQTTGALIVAPIPSGQGLENAFIEKAVKVALKRAKKVGITGADATPYILREITKATGKKGATGGKNLAANLALLENNSRIAAEIALALEFIV